MRPNANLITYLILCAILLTAIPVSVEAQPTGCTTPSFSLSLDFEDGQLPSAHGWQEYLLNGAIHTIQPGSTPTGGGVNVLQTQGLDQSPASSLAGWFYNTAGLVDLSSNWVFEAEVRCVSNCATGCSDISLTRFEDCNGGFVFGGPCAPGAAVPDNNWHVFRMEMDHATGLITSTIDGSATIFGLTSPARSLNNFFESPALVGAGNERHIGFRWSNSPGTTRTLQWDNISFIAYQPCSPPLEVDAGPDQSITAGCLAGTCATLTATASGGTAPYSYEWSTGDVTQSITVCPLVTTTYSVTVSDADTDANGCFRAIDEVDVIVTTYDDLVVTVTGSGPLCEAVCDGSVTANVTGGDGNYTFLWDDPSGQITQTATGLCAGTYTVQVTDGSGCSETASITINASTPLSIDICPNQNIASFALADGECSCNGKIVQMSVIYGGPAGATVAVGPNSSGGNITSYSNVQPGDTLTFDLGDIGNNWFWEVNGAVDADIHTSCSDDILNNINSTKSDFGHLGSYPNPDQNSNDGTFLVVGHLDENGNGCGVFDADEQCPLVQVSISISGGTPPYTYLWSNGSTDSLMQDSICETTNYTVTVTDAVGCTGVSAEHTATVVNIGCDEDKVTMCHHPGTPDAHTHCISVDDIQKKLDEGFTIGDCSTTFDPGDCGPAPPVICECKGGIQKFAFTYLGPSGANINFFNDNHPDPNDLIRSFTNVNTNDLLVIKSWAIGKYKFNSDISFTVNAVEGPGIHTSCSQPLQDAFFGDLYVTGYVDRYGNGCFLDAPCLCEGGVQTLALEYSGVSGAEVSFYNYKDAKSEDSITTFTNVQQGDTLIIHSSLIGENLFNNDMSFTINGIFGENIHTSCSQRLEDRHFGDICIAGFVDYMGNGCNLPSLPPPCGCEGKIIEVSVEYDGPPGATVTVGPDDMGNNPTNFTNVQPGDTLTANLGDIGNDWYWSVNGIVDAQMHTSCSDDILGNVNSTKSDFGHLGSYPNPDQSSNDGTFLVIGHRDDEGFACGYLPVSPKFVLQGSEQPGSIRVTAHPNPFTQDVTFEITSPLRQHIEVVVYDLTGREVATLINQEVEPNIEYSAVYSAPDAADGIYFYKLVGSAGGILSGKLIRKR